MDNLGLLWKRFFLRISSGIEFQPFWPAKDEKVVNENKISKLTTDPKKLLRLLCLLSPSTGQLITKESKQDNPVIGGYK